MRNIASYSIAITWHLMDKALSQEAMKELVFFSTHPKIVHGISQF